MVKARLPILEGASYQSDRPSEHCLTIKGDQESLLDEEIFQIRGTETILFWLFIGKFSKKYTESFPTFIKNTT